uniref:Uncharacterized protein n=1 Tax=Oryza punctata TaxID=4537 RepID=A0A0E0L128_ORYPU
MESSVSPRMNQLSLPRNVFRSAPTGSIDPPELKCACDLTAGLHTSHTERNLNHRFLTCGSVNKSTRPVTGMTQYLPRAAPGVDDKTGR